MKVIVTIIIISLFSNVNVTAINCPDSTSIVAASSESILKYFEDEEIKPCIRQSANQFHILKSLNKHLMRGKYEDVYAIIEQIEKIASDSSVVAKCYLIKGNYYL